MFLFFEYIEDIKDKFIFTYSRASVTESLTARTNKIYSNQILTVFAIF